MDGYRITSSPDMLAARPTRRQALRLLGAGLATAAGLARFGKASAIPGGPPIRVSGGGWFVPSGPPIREKITFGFQVHEVPPNPVVPPNPIRGTLSYHDHAAGVRLTSHAIDSLVVVGDSAASFAGIGQLAGGQQVAFRVEVTAGDSPSFAIAIDGAIDPTGEGVYARAGAVQGGQIKIEAAIQTEE